ncbi:hypothetical protein PSV08DRAFT_247891 [Bipolaris maydis]|uniref:uncharacterized protein n=1 Tax=Cochliobolus heterostrophus TaxID=5016 RepID=UPI0024D105FD|nr:hypothetical protein J3E73DRAFT_257518 [Bipolaris maydis]KAJ5033037.1 hypothetical protein J3E74DRAFT_296991 [Bipolaris maydis]KAJ5056453.1 hypothetical protein J3E74DRAFT_293900 [Bipolaris maydis]KAJ6270131.1 hypothetical protein PSV08DRAFT_247891 [Bipolaris maydis]KAJ6283757.1 hypothetical protein J3E71DRAFT_238442 [Bipolaris maydis]
MRYKNVSGGWLLAAPAAACCSHHHPAAMGERPAVQPTHPKRPPAPALVPNAILFISRRQAKGELASLARPHLETVQAGRPCWVGCLWSRTDDKLLRRPWAGVALVQHTHADRHGLRLTPSRRRLLAGVLTEARRGPAAISSPTAGPESRGGGEAWLGSDCGQAVVKQRPFAICHSAVGGRWTVDGARLRSNKRVERLRPSLPLHRSPTDRDHEDDAEHVHGCCPTRSSGAVAVPG